MAENCWGSGSEILEDITTAQDGSVITVGNTSSTEFGAAPWGDGFVSKISNSGVLIWQKTIGGSGTDYASNILVTAEDQLYILGDTNSNDRDVSGNHGNTDLWLVKLNNASFIRGFVFYDENANGVKEVNEKFADAIRITASKINYLRSAVTSNGEFQINVDTGAYLTKVDLQLPYYKSVPQAKNTSFNSYFQSDSFSLALQAVPNKKDLTINLLPLTAARPGSDVIYKISYKNVGTVNFSSGEILFKKDNRLEFISASSAINSINADTLKWNFSNLLPNDTASIILNLKAKIPPILNNGDTLLTSAFITPLIADETTKDNSSILRHLVTSSFDPNDKSERNAGVLTQDQLNSREWLQYVIRFQNTGNDTAFNIVIRDTLSNHVDQNSLEMVSASHGYELTIVDGNKLTWKFSSIHLPDSIINEPASHGFIAYKVRPKSMLSIMDTIKNSASIYFDYNLPIKTNTHNTIIANNNVVTGIEQLFPINKTELLVFPNPFMDKISIRIKDNLKGRGSISLTNAAGQIVFFKNLGQINLYNGYTSSIHISGIPCGVYTLMFHIANTIYSQKVVLK